MDIQLTALSFEVVNRTAHRIEVRIDGDITEGWPDQDRALSFITNRFVDECGCATTLTASWPCVVDHWPYEVIQQLRAQVAELSESLYMMGA